ncbi:MAG: hypothetical protein IIU58_02970 [Clostridia bacterium]|nr:hypothetical protein [Clostridia bacterium]
MDELLLPGIAEDIAALSLGIFVIVIYGFLFLLLLAQYLLNAFAMLRMAKKVGLPNGWMAFVPFADVYLLGQIADVNSQKKVNAKRLLLTFIALFVTLFLYIVGAFVYGFIMATGENIVLGVSLFVGTAVLMAAASICYSIFAYIAWYRICENFGGGNALGWFLGALLGSMLCSSLVPVILFLILSCKTPAMTVNGSTVVPPAAPPAPPQDDVFTA